MQEVRAEGEMSHREVGEQKSPQTGRNLYVR